MGETGVREQPEHRISFMNIYVRVVIYEIGKEKMFKHDTPRFDAVRRTNRQ